MNVLSYSGVSLALNEYHTIYFDLYQQVLENFRYLAIMSPNKVVYLNTIYIYIYIYILQLGKSQCHMPRKILHNTQ